MRPRLLALVKSLGYEPEVILGDLVIPCSPAAAILGARALARRLSVEHGKAVTVRMAVMARYHPCVCLVVQEAALDDDIVPPVELATGENLDRIVEALGLGRHIGESDDSLRKRAEAAIAGMGSKD